MSQILIINGHDIIFQIAKTYTMSEYILGRQTPTAVCTEVYKDHKYFKGKKLSINLENIGHLGQ